MVDILKQIKKDHENEMKRYDDVIASVKELNDKVKALVNELQGIINNTNKGGVL